MIPIWKRKGGGQDCNRYWRVALLSLLGTILMHLLLMLEWCPICQISIISMRMNKSILSVDFMTSRSNHMDRYTFWKSVLLTRMEWREWKAMITEFIDGASWSVLLRIVQNGKAVSRALLRETFVNGVSRWARQHISWCMLLLMIVCCGKETGYNNNYHTS